MGNVARRRRNHGCDGRGRECHHRRRLNHRHQRDRRKVQGQPRKRHARKDDGTDRYEREFRRDRRDQKRAGCNSDGGDRPSPVPRTVAASHAIIRGAPSRIPSVAPKDRTKPASKTASGESATPAIAATASAFRAGPAMIEDSPRQVDTRAGHGASDRGTRSGQLSIEHEHRHRHRGCDPVGHPRHAASRRAGWW